jgi:hypothetical protein
MMHSVSQIPWQQGPDHDSPFRLRPLIAWRLTPEGLGQEGVQTGGEVFCIVAGEDELKNALRRRELNAGFDRVRAVEKADFNGGRADLNCGHDDSFRPDDADGGGDGKAAA